MSEESTSSVKITPVPVTPACQAIGCTHSITAKPSPLFCDAHWKILTWEHRMDVAWTTKTKPAEASQEQYASEHKAALSAAITYIAREEKKGKS